MKKIPSYVLVSSLSTGCSWLAGIQPAPYQAVSLWGVSWGQGEQEKKGGCNPPPLPSPSLHLSSLDLAQRSWDPLGSRGWWLRCCTPRQAAQAEPAPLLRTRLQEGER